SPKTEINAPPAATPRHENKAHSASEAPTTARTGGEPQAYRRPPQLSASISAIAAPTISSAPSRSSLCRRSWRGSRCSTLWVSKKASPQSGKLNQKIQDQCRCSAMKPPTIGPPTVETMKVDDV